MSTTTFRDFIAEIDRIGDLKLLEGCDWDLEIGTLTELMAERWGPALLFEKIKGYPDGFRVLANPYSTPGRTTLGLDLPLDTKPLEVVNQFRMKLKNFKPIKPIEVNNGPVMENIQEGDKIDLFTFPSPRWHESDGGRYLGTGCAVITKDLEDEWTNLGPYRVQVHNRDTAGIFISHYHHGSIMMRKYWAKGKSCPIAVAIGVEPRIFLAGCMSMAWGTSEYDFAGWMKNTPVEIIKGKYTNLDLPAHAEIVIEGEVPPPEQDSQVEGPFGEFHGYYGGEASPQPVIKVRRIMFRNDPIIEGTPPIKPPFGSPSIPITNSPTTWNKLESMGITGIKGVYTIKAGGGPQITVVSMKQLYAGHSKQVGLATSSALSHLCRFIVVVDDDIDPSNTGEVLWAIATRCEPAESIDLLRGFASTSLDPRLSPEQKAKGFFTNTRAIMYAVKPYEWYSKFPQVNKASEELRRKISTKWSDLLGQYDSDATHS